MSTAVHVTPHRGIETATRYIHAAPTVAALFYPVALVAFYSGGRMVHDASTWEAWLSGWIVTLGGAILALRASDSAAACSSVAARRAGWMQQDRAWSSRSRTESGTDYADVTAASYAEAPCHRCGACAGNRRYHEA